MTTYIDFIIKNLEPLRIANISTSQRGQTDTLRYIPGSTIRGMVIGKLSKALNDFENDKKILLSDSIRFLNAYPVYDGVKLIPSLKGFYEDKKASGSIENVVIDGKFTDGYKRAKLGSFCYIDDNNINYQTTDIGDTLNINTSKKKTDVFRTEYLNKHQSFYGQIAINDDAVKYKDDIISTLQSDNIKLGSNITAGYGRCEISDIRINNQLPYGKYSITKDKAIKGNSLYMMLLSSTAMVNKFGEICGIDEESLTELLGVEGIRVKYCSTSVSSVSGVNRTWGSRTPSINMYDAGSVFKLEYNGHLEIEKLIKLEHDGLGIRLTEGCGRVLFLADYEKINHKNTITRKDNNQLFEIELNAKLNNENSQTLLIAAKGIYKNRIDRAIERYIIDERNSLEALKKGASDSQIGLILSMCTVLQYTPEIARDRFSELFEHIDTKKTNVNIKYKGIKGFVNNILNVDLNTLLNINGKICGYELQNILSDNEIVTIKLQLIERIIRFYMRGK